MLRYSLDWRHAYDSVLRETDRYALFERVEIAEAAIRTRRDALPHIPDHDAERRALEDALAHLRVIKSEFLGFPSLDDGSFKALADQERHDLSVPQAGLRS
jgi:hypothetical protein